MMPALALGLALSSMQVEGANTAAALPVEVHLDQCVDVDRIELMRLLAVELANLREPGSDASPTRDSLSIEVSCTSQPDVVRITARRGTRQSIRELDLRAAGQAARRARARELSLLIAESVKARDEPAPAASPQRPVPVQREAKPQPWLELGMSGGAEKYSSGYAQIGPTVSARLLRLTPLLIEARLGGRWAPELRTPAGPVKVTAWLFAVGAGLDVLPQDRAAGLALLARLECDWLFAEGRSQLPDTLGTADEGRAYLVSLASSAWVRLGHGLRVVAEPALLLPIRALVFHDRGRAIAGLSGLGAAASVGLSLRL